MDKPSWWPENPYPKTIFPMPREKYAEIVPDPHIRTALSGMLGREFWDIASKSIWDAQKEHIEDIDEYIEQIEQLQAELKQAREVSFKWQQIAQERKELYEKLKKENEKLNIAIKTAIDLLGKGS